MWVPRPRYSLRAIRTAWIVTVLWLEIGIFIAAGARCRWPDPGGVRIASFYASLASDRLGHHREDGKATHILLVADPQILDGRSYPERSSLPKAVSRIFVDMNLRKAWRVAKGRRPHAVIFLGDMMDNGFVDMHIMEYQEYVGRFRSIFPAPPSVPVYYIPGNHDVGLGNRGNTSSLARPRYRSAFGPLSQHVVLGGHSLFMVDAPALVDEDWRRENAGEDRMSGLPQDLEYLRHMCSERGANAPLILFTHIPLYRPGSNCGPLRENGFTIPYISGEGYRMLLSPETSRLLLYELHPTLIFSGDDHDYCEYIHTFHGQRIPEVTVKSLSIAMGIRQPGFQLLSLSSKEHSNAHQPCLLPDQVHIYCWVYAPLFFATIVLVAASALITGPSRYKKHKPKRSLELPFPTSQQLRSVPPHKGSYRMRVAEEMWAVTWPPLAVYMVIAFMTFLVYSFMYVL